MPQLPVKPLADYLFRYMERNELDMETLAEVVGVPARTIFAWRNERNTVQFDVLDRAMLRVGALWFDIYDDQRWPFEHKVAARVFDPPRSPVKRKKAA